MNTWLIVIPGVYILVMSWLAGHGVRRLLEQWDQRRGRK